MENLSHTTRLFFLRVFDIRNGELQRALLMQFNIFLIISTLLIVKPTVNGLFLAKFGVEQLPFAFILVAITAALVSIVYSRLLARISLYKLNVGTLLFSIISLVVFGIFLHLSVFEGPVLYLFYIWVAIFALLSTSQFWVLANMVFNPREAKRIFGFVGAGAIAGGIFGGYLTLLLAESLGSEYLPFVCAVILSICIPITRIVWKKSVVSTTTQLERKIKTPRDVIRPWKLIQQSKHLTYIACIVGLSVMVAKLVDYQFGGIASRLIPDADELTAFFGFWFSTFNVLSLLLQLFLTNRLVGTFGVGTSLFFLPGMILFAAVLLLIFPGLLMAAVFLKMTDGSLKQSVNKASMELLIMPISSEIKNKTKTFIDVFVDSLATGIIGLLLIFIIKGLDFSMTAVSWIILFLLLLWIYFADKVRKEYLRTFRIKLREVAPMDQPEKRFDLSNVSVLDGFRRILSKGDDNQILFVLEKLRETPDERMFQEIKALLNHPSDEIKTEALRNLYFLKSENLSLAVRRLVNHPLQKVKIAAFEYLLLREPKDAVALMKQYANDPDPKVRSAALVSFAKEFRQNPDVQTQLGLDQLIDQKIKEIETTEDPETLRFLKIGLLKAIGYANFSSYFHIIKLSFSDPDPAVVKESITAASHTLSTLFINDLIAFLKNKDTSLETVEALARYDAMLIPILRYRLDQEELELDTLRNIPAVLKRIGRKSSVDLLFELLDHSDNLVRFEALRGLNQLRTDFPYLNFYPEKIMRTILYEARLYQDTLTALHVQSQLEKKTPEQVSQDVLGARRSLIALLEKKLHKNLERIFRLLGLKYPPEDIFNIYRGLNSKNSELTSSAIEFLDNLLEPTMKKTLIPIVETSMLETISEEAVKNLKLKIPDESECIHLLLEIKDVRVKIATLYLIIHLKDKSYLPLIHRMSDHPNEKIRNYAREAKASLEAV